MNCRILKNKKCIITQEYKNNHQGLDIVGEDNKLDFIIAHSDGKVTFVQDGYDNIKGSIGNSSYGNCVKIDHLNGYYTLYAHMKVGLFVNNGQTVSKGQVIGYMSDSGNAYGAHLHFEVWKNNNRIDPTEYLNQEFNCYDEIKKYKYKIGDVVQINGVYVSSVSNNKLIPKITKGKITNIIENVNNPYLLENGNIGWVNDSCIIEVNSKYLSNYGYKGNSIVDALNQIEVDSSYNYRSKLAILNNIDNYVGSAEQNTYLLKLLKTGMLKS